MHLLGLFGEDSPNLWGFIAGVIWMDFSSSMRSYCWGYLEGVSLICKELLCNSSLLCLWELCSMLISGIHYTYSTLSSYFKDWVHNIWYQRRVSLVLFLQISHLTIFTMTFYCGFEIVWDLWDIIEDKSNYIWYKFENLFF